MDTPTVLPGAARQYLARYYDRLDRVEEDFARTRLSDSLSCNAARQMALVLRAAVDLARWLPGGLVSPSLISLAATIGEGAGSYAARLDAPESADTAGSANEEDLRLSQVWVRHILARTLVGMRAAPLSLSPSLGVVWLSAAAYACRGILDGCRLSLRFPLSEESASLLKELRNDTRRAENACSRLLRTETTPPPPQGE